MSKRNGKALLKKLHAKLHYEGGMPKVSWRHRLAWWIAGDEIFYPLAPVSLKAKLACLIAGVPVNPLPSSPSAQSKDEGRNSRTNKSGTTAGYASSEQIKTSARLVRRAEAQLFAPYRESCRARARENNSGGVS